jgi:hypothetical protein
MSQRECAGFNWPPLSIPASEPVSISPEAVSRAGPQIAAAIDKSCGDPLRSISDSEPSSVRTFFSPSAALVVGQPANSARSPVQPLLAPCPSSRVPTLVASDRCCNCGCWPPSRAGLGCAAHRRPQTGTGHSRRRNPWLPGQRVQGRSNIDVFARNLLSKDDCRAALAMRWKCWPKVPLVSKPSSFACRAERLARTGTGPNRSIVGQPARRERKGPDADAGEEMALGESCKVGGVYILNAPFVDHARRDVAGGDQVAQPLRPRMGRSRCSRRSWRPAVPAVGGSSKRVCAPM